MTDIKQIYTPRQSLLGTVNPSVIRRIAPPRENGTVRITSRGYSKEILTAMRVMVVSIGSRGSHIPAMTPRRLRRGVIAGM